MEVMTFMGVVVLGLKCASALAGSIGVAAGVNWFNKKDFKKKGVAIDDETEHEPKIRFR